VLPEWATLEDTPKEVEKAKQEAEEMKKLPHFVSNVLVPFMKMV
jgi:hypothetical protein